MNKYISYIAKTGLSFIIIILFNSKSYAKDNADNCNLINTQKMDKNVKDLICDKELGNFFLKYSPGKRLIWIENRKNGLKFELDHFVKDANPELVETERHIKFVTPKVIRQGGKIFIGAVFVHRSRGNNGMGQCGSGSEEYFVSIEITKRSLIKKKQFLIESCFEPYQLRDSENGKNLNLLGVLDGDEIVFDWYEFEDREGLIRGRFNFISNELKLSEQPRPGVKPKLIEGTEPQKK